MASACILSLTVLMVSVVARHGDLSEIIALDLGGSGLKMSRIVVREGEHNNLVMSAPAPEINLGPVPFDKLPSVWFREIVESEKVRRLLGNRNWFWDVTPENRVYVGVADADSYKLFGAKTVEVITALEAQKIADRRYIDIACIDYRPDKPIWSRCKKWAPAADLLGVSSHKSFIGTWKDGTAHHYANKMAVMEKNISHEVIATFGMGTGVALVWDRESGENVAHALTWPKTEESTKGEIHDIMVKLPFKVVAPTRDRLQAVDLAEAWLVLGGQNRELVDVVGGSGSKLSDKANVHLMIKEFFEKQVAPAVLKEKATAVKPALIKPDAYVFSGGQEVYFRMAKAAEEGLRAAGDKTPVISGYDASIYVGLAQMVCHKVFNGNVKKEWVTNAKDAGFVQQKWISPRLVNDILLERRSGTIFNIESDAKPGYFLADQNGGNLALTKDYPGDDRWAQFKFILRRGDIYNIESVQNPGFFLDARSSRKLTLANPSMADTWAQFRLVLKSHNSYNIESVSSPGRFLETSAKIAKPWLWLGRRPATFRLIPKDASMVIEFLTLVLDGTGLKMSRVVVTGEGEKVAFSNPAEEVHFGAAPFNEHPSDWFRRRLQDVDIKKILGDRDWDKDISPSNNVYVGLANAESYKLFGVGEQAAILELEKNTMGRHAAMQPATLVFIKNLRDVPVSKGLNPNEKCKWAPVEDLLGLNEHRAYKGAWTSARAHLYASKLRAREMRAPMGTIASFAFDQDFGLVWEGHGGDRVAQQLTHAENDDVTNTQDMVIGLPVEIDAPKIMKQTEDLDDKTLAPAWLALGSRFRNQAIIVSGQGKISRTLNDRETVQEMVKTFFQKQVALAVAENGLKRPKVYAISGSQEEDFQISKFAEAGLRAAHENTPVISGYTAHAHIGVAALLSGRVVFPSNEISPRLRKNIVVEKHSGSLFHIQIIRTATTSSGYLVDSGGGAIQVVEKLPNDNSAQFMLILRGASTYNIKSIKNPGQFLADDNGVLRLLQGEPHEKLLHFKIQTTDDDDTYVLESVKSRGHFVHAIGAGDETCSALDGTCTSSPASDAPQSLELTKSGKRTAFKFIQKPR